jgi:hypothetical protein
MRKVDVLAMVADQFMDVRHQLELQLARMAQIQAQLDRIHAAVKLLLDHEHIRS